MAQEMQQTQYGMNPLPPVMAQPGQPIGAAPTGPAHTQWMPAVPPQPNCPPGMEYLTQLDQLLVQQETHLLEILTGWECKNKFKVLNSVGQQVYYAMEESGLCQRIWCESERGFIYHITDNMQQEIFRIRRDFRCCTGCWCCPFESCYYYAVVEDRNGQVIGHVSNLTFCCKPLFGIFDEQKNLIAEIRGPCCPCQAICCTADVDFPIVDIKDQSTIGTISKQWPGLLKDMFTDSDNFRVSFPIDMDVRKKALMFAAIFVIDMMLYESNQNNN